MGKTVLLADWAAARPPGVTSWLSCDRADADPVRFWAGFIEAPRAIEPEFGADARDLLAMDRTMSADVIASVANDVARLPAGSVIIVDDFHFAAAAAAPDMTDLVEHWPAGTVQLVLAGRSDPPLRQHRLRMSGQLSEIRDRDLYFSLTESRDLLANFGVQISDADLALLHERSEGWPAVLQMAALSLRGTTDPARLARVLEVRSQHTADYFVSEVLDQQPPEVAQFMLDTSILGGADRGRVRGGHRKAGRGGDAARHRRRALVPGGTRRGADQLPVSPSGTPGAARRVARQGPRPRAEASPAGGRMVRGSRGQPACRPPLSGGTPARPGAGAPAGPGRA